MIYLDNAATSFPKPESVAKTISDYIINVGANINRGGYEAAYSAAGVVLETREMLNDMFNGYGPRSVVFTPGNTYSLNFLIKGLARQGDRFLCSGMEHNAVHRPLYQMQQLGIIDIGYMPCDRDGSLILDESLDMIDENIRAVVMLHASNVSGTILPIDEIGQRCHEKGVIFIVDAAQTAGIIPIDMHEYHISGLAVPAHKSLMGPQGLGAMLIDPDLTDEIVPIIAGGTGSHSDMANMPEELPDRYESGTLNLPGIFGLHAALEWMMDNIDNIRRSERELIGRFLDGIRDIDNVRLAGIDGTDGRVGVISLDFIERDNGMVAFSLEQDHGIMTRVGLHCAPLAHSSLGTFPEGTVRFSIGAFTTPGDVDQAIEAIRELA